MSDTGPPNSDASPQEKSEVKPGDQKAEAAASAVASSIAKDNKDASMHVKIYAPFRTYFDGQAVSVSAVNDTGPFDILPKHHNFMTLLNPCDIIVRTTTGEERVTITRGIMHVKADQVVVFLDV
jgi:ATP synthase, Delta/Epsilon chain, beta-sandwich domain